MYAFRILNVFTVDDDPFSGNPLCVFEDARGLTDAQMQSLARQMNLSETTFVLPASRDADARVRIFTPGFEMPFAGHPTLGTASVVAQAQNKDRVTLEMIAGLVPVERGVESSTASSTPSSMASSSAWTLRAAKAPATRPVDASRDELAAMLGLPSGSVSDEPLWVNTGVEQLVIPLATVELVRATKPVIPLIEKHGFSATRQEAMAYVWARDPRNATSIDVRFFFTSNGALLEDPATGSACANLGGWMIARGATRPISATLSQGLAIERPSRLGLRVDERDQIFVTGSVIEIGRGSMSL
ncbi:MAG: PhzF family phenazine biosynthesis protein [Kofleriaceae bacterium]